MEKLIFKNIILFALFFCSCKEKISIKNTDQIDSSNLFEVKGILLNADSIKPPKVIIAGVPKSIKAGLPETFVIKPNQGEAGGITQMQNYTTENGLPLDAISFGFKSSICDKTGNIWFCTPGGGVSRYNGNSFTNYTAAQGLASNEVGCIVEDRTGNFWFGTGGDGVSCYNGRYFSNFNLSNGLINNVVFSVIEDKIGNLWFGTNGGVSRLNVNRTNNLCINRTCTHDLKIQHAIKEHNIEISKSFTSFTIKNGLSNNIVESIAEDKAGNIWFGTFGGGVSRYDGNRIEAIEKGAKFTIHNQRDLKRVNGKLVKSFVNFNTAHGLAHNVVFTILKDKNGNLWFGTKGGLSRFNESQANLACCKNSCSHDLNTKLGLEEHHDELLKSFTNFTTQQGLPNNVIVCLTEDKRGNIWIGTNGGGVSRFDGKSFTNFSTEQGLSSNNIYSITEDKTGNLWFGEVGGGVSCYNGKSFTNFTTTQGLPYNIVESIMEDKSGNLWFGTEGRGVSRYDGKSFTNFNKSQGLAADEIFSICEDEIGNLWFGTNNGGVSCYNGSRVESIENINKTSQQKRVDVKKIKGGLTKFFDNYTTDEGLTNDVVLSIIKDKIGNMWFGTLGGGVSRYDGNRIDAIERGDITSQQQKTDLKRINGKYLKTFTNFSTEQGLINNVVWSICEDKKGNIWFGTAEGVSFYDGKFFTNYTTAQGLASNDVRCIIEDGAGIIWLATAGGGVSRWDGKIFKNFTTTEGLPDNTITQLALSKEQNLVVGSNNGIGILTSFNRNHIISEGRSISENLPKKIATINALNNKELNNYEPTIEIYNSVTGFPVKDITSGQGGLFCDSKGIIWAGTGSDKTALVRFDYNALNRNVEKPLVLIERIKIDEKNIFWYDLESENLQIANEKSDTTIISSNIIEEFAVLGRTLNKKERDSLKIKFSEVKFESISKFYQMPRNLILPYEHNHVSFKFTAIEPAKPFLVKYQYILEGYDKEWSPLTNRTEVSYGNIHEGIYVFKLRAQSPFGVWSDPITYTFKVLPPFWRTWWMYSIYLLVVVSLIYGFIKRRERKLISDRKNLEKIVIERTAEVVEQKHLIEEKHREITDSINYAERIQRSFLATKELLNENLKDHFVFFQPKDVVSGDFYWANKLSNGSFALATADSTGHGVPGAIMSLLNITSLEAAIKEGFIEPSDILNATRKTIIERLKKDGSELGGKDGMDASLICFDFINNKVTYAAANNPIWIVRNKEIIELAPDKMPVGKHDRDTIPFTQNEVILEKGDVVYALTDGMPDQFGGPKGKKFMYKKLKELLISISQEPMESQKQKLMEELNNWQGDLEQVDDICLIGVRIS